MLLSLSLLLLSVSPSYSVETALQGPEHEDAFDVHFDVTTLTPPTTPSTPKSFFFLQHKRPRSEEVQSRVEVNLTDYDVLAAAQANGHLNPTGSFVQALCKQCKHTNKVIETVIQESIVQIPISDDYLPAARRSLGEERNFDGKLTFFQDPLSNAGEDVVEAAKVVDHHPIAGMVPTVYAHEQQEIVTKAAINDYSFFSEHKIQPAIAYAPDMDVEAARRAYLKKERVGKFSFFEDPLSKLEVDTEGPKKNVIIYTPMPPTSAFSTVWVPPAGASRSAGYIKSSYNIKT